MAQGPVRLAWFLSLIVALTFLPPPILGQQKEGKKYAVLVGVKDYEHPQLSKLRFTENDIEGLGERLRSKHFRYDMVRVLTNSRGMRTEKDMPTAENIRREIDSVLEMARRGDTVLIALSGHGVQLTVADPDEKGKDKSYPYFCPSDCDFRNISYSTGKAKRLIQLESLFADLGSSRATQKLVLVDACRNDSWAESATRNANLKQLTVPKGVAVLFSCDEGEVSWENARLGKGHGVFFHYLLQGLSGKARNSEDDDITWDDLSRYVKRHVIRETPRIIGGGARQTPHGLNNIAGETLIARFNKANSSIVNSIGMTLELIPAGEFVMGTPVREREAVFREVQDLFKLSTIPDWLAAEGPQRKVKISQGFYLGAQEVTQAEYEKVVGKNPSHFCAEGSGKARVKGLDTSRFPVEMVSWEDAVEFCRKLTEKEKGQGRIYRLPTEAEWEYACRAGTTTPFHYGEDLSVGQANFKGTSPFATGKKGEFLRRPSDVGSYTANRFGLYDMHGNVWEWCSDWYDEGYYRKAPNLDPTGPATGRFRVIRGGCWDNHSRDCRTGLRLKQSPDFRDAFIGFRVVCITR